MVIEQKYNLPFKRPVWICGHRKCGTTLLTNLLDGHESLLNYGPDVRLIYALYDVFHRFSSPSERKERFYQLFWDGRLEGHQIRRLPYPIFSTNSILPIKAIFGYI